MSEKLRKNMLAARERAERQIVAAKTKIEFIDELLLSAGIEKTANGRTSLPFLCLDIIKRHPKIWWSSTQLARKLVEEGTRNEETPSLSSKVTMGLKRFREDTPDGIECKQDGPKFMFRVKEETP